MSNDAADAMVNAGVFVAVAAGNSNVDAGQTSPASAPLVCTVGATDSNDVRAEFSSYGPVVDIWAPGVDLASTSYEGGEVCYRGTSQEFANWNDRHRLPALPVRLRSLLVSELT